MTDESKIFVTRDGETLSLFFPPGAARGIQTNISQLSSGELRRTINGALIDLTRAALRKYSVSLSADGQAFPDLRGMWRGQKVTVAPPVWWTAYVPAGMQTVQLERPAADGSWTLRDAATGETLAFGRASDGLSFSSPYPVTPESVLEYQPVFTCRVVSVSMSGDEWEATATWSLELEEV